MTATAFLSLKQQVAKLSQKERVDLSAYLLRLRQEDSVWKKKTARKITEMQAGKQTGVAELREQLGHAK
jgi:hypothetical protein